MSTTHICSACRRSILATIRGHTAGQSRRRSSFFSLANTRSSVGDTVAQDTSAIGDSYDFQDWPTRSKHEPSFKNVRSSRTHPVDLLDALFEEGRGTPAKRKATFTNVELHAHIETLKGLLANPDESIVDIWEYFTSHLSARAWLSDTGQLSPQPPAFKPITSTLLHRLQTFRLESRKANPLPTVTDITSVYASLGLLHPSDWKVLLYDLLHRLSELTYTRDCTGAELSSEQLRYSLDFSEDILGAWKVLCDYYCQKTDQKEPRFGGLLQDWKLPLYPHDADLRSAKVKGGLDEVFLLLWPCCPKDYISSMTSAALVTFSLLTHAIPRRDGHNGYNNPFIRAIAKLLVAARCDVRDILKSQATGDLVLKQLSVDWSSALGRAEAISSHRHAGTQYSVVRPLHSSSSILFQKLSRATTERDLEQIDNLWTEAKLSVQRKTNANDERGREMTELPIVNNHEMMSQKLYNQFLVSYLELRQRGRALDVWDHMIETARYPTLSNWHAMLEGCRRARDPTSLEAVWAKLRSSALQLDVGCWRTRISGLIECGKLESAVRALHEMGRDWQEATKRQHQSKGAVKPTIETINDTISSLLKRGYHSAAKGILAWGDTFGITADLVTFNILLRGLIRDGRIQAVPLLLTEMQKQGIQADVATFTTILDELFKTSGPMSSDEQLKITNLVFTEMETAGVQPNRFTYNKIISSLLQTQPKDMKAVQAVLARMAAQKIEIPRDIYTMLVKHLFSQEPPDLEGVRSLLNRIRISGAIMDHIFWDRVIEGYASVGDTANALSMLRRMDKKSSRAGWPTLEVVLRALVQNKEWEMARQVVSNVYTDRGRPPDIGQRGVEGQHSFWRAVGEFGLMDTLPAG